MRSQVIGYQRIDARTRERAGHRGASTCRPRCCVTRAVWYTFDDDVVDDAGLVAASAWPAPCTPSSTPPSGMLPLFTICDRWDVGGVSTALQADTGLPTIIIYDGYPGGAGIAELAFEAADRHLRGHRSRSSATLPVHRRLPVVRAVAQVRQRQRAPRQGRGPGPGPRRARVCRPVTPTPTATDATAHRRTDVTPTPLAC